MEANISNISRNNKLDSQTAQYPFTKNYIKSEPLLNTKMFGWVPLELVGKFNFVLSNNSLKHD